jgi:hypothetical protein
MSTTFNDTWDKDWKDLFGDGTSANPGDIQTFLNEQKDYQKAVENYHEAMQRIKNTSDASVAFTMLAWLMANQGFDQLNGQQAIDGGALQIQGDLTKLGNDLEDMTNQSDDATFVPADGSTPAHYIYNQKYPDNYLHKVAVRSYELMDQLNNNIALRGSDKQQGAIGEDAANALASQYQIIRFQIYDSDTGTGEGHAGPNSPKYHEGAGPADGIYFDATNQDPNPDPGRNPCMMSYAEFQNDLSNRGDAKMANEASKQKTDAFNENTSTTQSTNAASQEQISNDSNMSKSVQAFVTAMFHAVMDVISAANKATTKGS